MSNANTETEGALDREQREAVASYDRARLATMQAQRRYFAALIAGLRRGLDPDKAKDAASAAEAKLTELQTAERRAAARVKRAFWGGR